MVMQMLLTDFTLHPFFALNHAEAWVKLDPFTLYIAEHSTQYLSVPITIGSLWFSSVSLSCSGTPFFTIPAVLHSYLASLSTHSINSSCCGLLSAAGSEPYPPVLDRVFQYAPWFQHKCVANCR